MINHPDRARHEIDKYSGVYVTDKPLMGEGDSDNHDILVTDKETENYDCTGVHGIQSCCNIIAFRNENVHRKQHTSEMDSVAAITAEGQPSQRIFTTAVCNKLRNCMRVYHKNMC
jgi:hypothetical protein